jgi:Zn-dependent oligopeptidase
METPENVNDFLDSLAESIRARASADFATLTKFKNSTKPLMQWDMPYLTQKFKKYK